MIAALLRFLHDQPMFTGLVGAALAAGLMFLVRQLPGRILQLLAETLTVTLVVTEREEAFQFLTTWLGRHSAVGRARRLMMTQAYDFDERRWRWRMTLGAGWHLIRYRGAFILVNRELKEAGEIAQLTGAKGSQRLWLRSFGRSQDAIRELMDEARRVYFGDGLVNVHFFDQGWIRADCRPPRPLETVFMPQAQKNRVIDDVARFLAARETYRTRGVPWRRGYLLQGPPGTGKTTLIFALAGIFGRPVFALNLNNIQSDNQLVQAFNNVDHDGIVVIEDIDTIRITRDRDKVEAMETRAAEVGIGVLAKPQGAGITLSGLLNAIDGLAAREGRLLFITSNHPELLDPALVRPGRIDLVEEIAPLGRADALAMAAAFGRGPEALDGVALPVSAAALQAVLLAPEPDTKAGFVLAA